LYPGVLNKKVGFAAGTLSESRYNTSLKAELITAAALI
jgi:hypothetical protein